jgi:hypothetical protein
MKTLTKIHYSLLLITAIAFIMIGCDGYHHTVFTVDPGAKSSETVLTSSVNRAARPEVEAFLLDFSSRNKMWCHPYDPEKHSMFCGTSPGINVELHEHPDTGLLTLRIAQFGPWRETKEYLALRDSLLAEIPARFPGAFVSGRR